MPLPAPTSWRRAAVRATFLAVLLVPAGAGAEVVHSSNGPFVATMHAGTHHPRPDHPWPVLVTASYRHQPVRASALYRFLLAGHQIGPTQFPGGDRRFSFYGTYRDVLEFPSRSGGVPIVLRLALRAHGMLIVLDYPVEIRT